MILKYKVALVLFVIAILGVGLGLDLRIGAAVVNIILFIAGFLAFWLSVTVLIFSKTTDKTIGSVLKRAIEALLIYGW